MKKVLAAALGFLTVVAIAGCNTNDADVVSHNLSQEADRFNIYRRVVFYNGITGDYMLQIEGLCSLGNDRTESEIAITCKVDKSVDGAGYKKHFLGLSDNVTYFVEQLEGAEVSDAHYKVVFKPSVIIPDIDIE